MEETKFSALADILIFLLQRIVVGLDYRLLRVLDFGLNPLWGVFFFFWG